MCMGLTSDYCVALLISNLAEQEGPSSGQEQQFAWTCMNLCSWECSGCAWLQGFSLGFKCYRG